MSRDTPTMLSRLLALPAALLLLSSLSGCADRLLPVDPGAAGASKIVFTEITGVSGGEYTTVVARVDADGAARADLTDGVIVAPPGRAGAVVMRDEYDIWFIPVEGALPVTPRLAASVRQSSDKSTIDPVTVALAPSGERITYTTRTRYMRYSEQRTIIAGVGGEAPVTLPWAVTAGLMPSFSPDGTRLAFYSFDTVVNDGLAHLAIINVDGSGFRVLESLGDSLLSEYSSVEWSPSGDRVVFCRPAAGNRNEVRVIGADGTAGRTISEGIMPTWDPTGENILFTLVDDAADLYLSAADGSGTPRRITTTPSVTEYYPRYSPDGTKLLYTAYPSLSNREQGHLTVHDLSTGATKVVSETAFKGYWVK